MTAGAADRYVLVLTEAEWARIAIWFGWLPGAAPKADARLFKLLSDAPYGDASMLLDAAEDGASSPRQTREDYEHVIGFISRIRIHWDP